MKKNYTLIFTTTVLEFDQICLMTGKTVIENAVRLLLVFLFLFMEIIFPYEYDYAIDECCSSPTNS